MRVLMAEDEKYLAKAVAEVLKKNHYAVDLAYDGVSGLDCALTDVYDMVILDIMLPKQDGLSVLRNLREAGISTPVILLTARGELDDKVKGLDMGADDYLAKPFHTDELLARMRALGRRRLALTPDGHFKYAGISLDPGTLTLSGAGGQIHLSLKEAQLMEYFIQNGGRILSKDTLLEKVWGYDSNAEHNHVEVQIFSLRRKLTQLGIATEIRTIRGAGYMLSSGEDSSHV